MASYDPEFDQAPKFSPEYDNSRPRQRGAEQCQAGKAALAWLRYRNPLGFAFREIQSL